MLGQYQKPQYCVATSCFKYYSASYPHGEKKYVSQVEKNNHIQYRSCTEKVQYNNMITHNTNILQ